MPQFYLKRARCLYGCIQVAFKASGTYSIKALTAKLKREQKDCIDLLRAIKLAADLKNGDVSSAT